MNLEIKKGKGIDELVGSGIPEEEKGLQAEQNHFSEILKGLETMLADSRIPAWASQFVLLPSEINTFIQTTIAYSDHKDYDQTGHLISALIQSSYDNGHNGFVLQGIERPYFYLIGHLNGKEDDPIKLQIKGYAGVLCGQYSSHVSLDMPGDCGHGLSSWAHDTTATVTGKLDRSFGVHAKRCTFKIPRRDLVEFPKSSPTPSNRIVLVGTGEVIHEF